MRISILTIFPGMFEGVFEWGLLAKARKSGLVQVDVVNLRDFATDVHRTVDDRPFVGGEGMVFKPEPLAAAIRALKEKSGGAWVVYLTPQGRRVDQQAVRRLSGRESVVLLCGRYEGVDQRIIDAFVDEEISVGDLVLSGGEFGAMMLTDAMVRLVPGVVGHPDSIVNESFENGLLDYPVYTRPAEFEGAAVPEVLLSGDHKRIKAWRKARALETTQARRPDLIQTENG